MYKNGFGVRYPTMVDMLKTNELNQTKQNPLQLTLIVKPISVHLYSNNIPILLCSKITKTAFGKTVSYAFKV